MAAGTDALAHVFRPGSAPGPALLALHGTGGDELDMLSLASAVAPGAPVLSPRGAVREGPANRWFRRFAEGVFDLDDLRRRAADLAAWIAAAREQYRDGLAGRPLVALGYSNGANIAAATLLAGHGGAVDAAVLLRAQHTLDAAAGLDLRGGCRCCSFRARRTRSCPCRRPRGWPKPSRPAAPRWRTKQSRPGTASTRGTSPWRAAPSPVSRRPRPAEEAWA